MSEKTDDAQETFVDDKQYGVLGFIEGKPRSLDEWEDEDRVSVYPHLISREFLAFGALFAVLLVVAALFDAPLEELANPAKTPNPAKAPWYFLSLQELLHYSPPFIAGVVAPGLLVFTVASIPFYRGRMRVFPIAFLIACLLIPMTDGIIWSAIHMAAPAFADSIRVYGIPTFALLIVASFFIVKFALSQRFDEQEAVDNFVRKGFLYFVGILTVLVLVGQYFRGPEWRWVWPWQ